MFEGHTVTVLICAKNEAINLPHVLPKIPIWVDEILVVDGHSSDGTAQIVKRESPTARLIEQPKTGKGDALRFGIRNASSEIIATIDADGQTDPADIFKFVQPLIRGADFAKGTRLKYGRPSSMRFHKFIGNKILVLAANLMFNAKYTDVAAGLRAFYKAKVEDVDITNGGEADQELQVGILRKGLKVVEVPYTHLPRISGESRFRDFPQGLRNLFAIIRTRAIG